MLSHYENHLLREIEREFTAEDPRLASALRDGPFGRLAWLRMATPAFGVAVFALGCVTGNVILVLNGLGYAGVGGWMWYRFGSRRRNAASPSSELT